MLSVRAWHFELDDWLRVPPPPWAYVPYPIAHFLGYRSHDKPQKPVGNVLSVFWAFIGVWCGVSVVEAVNMHMPSFQAHGAPLIVGSFGAMAVLEFYAIEAPLAQPRNAFFGQTLSSIIGVAIAKLFLHHPDFKSVQWAGGALACACATSVMALTQTVHPPAGATALLAVADDTLVSMGWFMIPVVMLGSVLMLAVALLVNNVQRRFPMYWWTPRKTDPKTHKDEALERKGPGSQAASDSQEEVKDVEASTKTAEIVVRRGHVSIPTGLSLRPEEEQFLESLAQRL